MKRLLLIMGLLLLGCNPTTEVVQVIKGDKGNAGTSCTVVSLENGASLSCTDGTSVSIFNGTNGVDGADGSAGIDGTNGVSGNNGADGNDGASCSVQSTSSGAMITCGESSANVLNGSNGQDGAAGSDGKDGSNSTASITFYGSSSCILIAGTTTYTKAYHSNMALFTASNCASSSKFAEVSQGEAYWVSASKLGVWIDGGLQVISFN